MFKRVYFFFLAYISVTGYGQTLLFLWFLQNGVSYGGMLLYFLVQCFSAVIIFFLLQGRSFDSRVAMFIGVLASAGGVLASSLITHPLHVLGVGFLFGVTNAFFWTVFNALYFQHSRQGEHGFKSGLYFLFFPISGAIFYPLAGFVAEKFGYTFLFTSSLIFYLVPLTLVFFLPAFTFKFNTLEVARSARTKALIFLQGYTDALGFALIPIFTLFFINTPFKLGNFFGYLSILSAFGALLNSKISDMIKKRAFFFYFFTVLNSLSYIPIAFTRSFFSFQFFTGMNNVANNLSNPFTVTLVLDESKANPQDMMLGREIYLNLGRTAMMALSLVILWLTHSFWTVLVVASISTMLYPLVAWWQKVYYK